MAMLEAPLHPSARFPYDGGCIAVSAFADIPGYGEVAARERTAQVLDHLVQAGLLRIMLPQQQGGHNLGRAAGSSLEFLRVLQTVGTVDLAAGRIFEGHVNAMLLILQHARGERRNAWEADIRADRIFGVWNTDGPSPVSMRVDGESIVLTGAKHFCSGAGRVAQALITATLEDGRRRMIIVPMAGLDDQRIDRGQWRPLGMESSDSFCVDFSGLRLSLDTLLGEPGAYLEEPWFQGGSIRFVAVQLGGAMALAEEMYRYIRTRKRTEDAFQQYRAGEIAVAIESGRLWIEGAARFHDQMIAHDNGVRLSADELQKCITYMRMARVAVEHIIVSIANLVDRSVGANGLLEPLPFAQLHRDLMMYVRQPAPDAAVTAIGREQFR